jgi:4-aminobutyrate aminotransferase
MGALSLSGHTSMSKFMGSPIALKVPYPYCYRCPFHLEYPDCSLYCVDFIDKQIFKTICPPEDVSCIIVEPIQSDGGDIVPPNDFLPELKKLCEKHGVLLAVDEVKIGFGRTGKMFGVDHSNIEPDIIVLAKPIASGMPLSAVVARAEILDSRVASHLLTTGGHPVACAAALANIKVIQDEKLPDNARRLGNHIIKRLKEMMADHEVIGDVRGRGLIVGVELVKDRETKEPASVEAAKICYRAWELGLITIYVGVHSNVIEITPPLIISMEQVEKGLNVLENAISDVEKGKVPDEKIAEYKGW